MKVGMNGTVGVLNVGVGDTKLSFDPKNQAERIRAARIVKDMIRRGYALLVEVEVDGEKKFTRALDFDENVCEYIVADFDPIAAARADEEEQQQQETDHESSNRSIAEPISAPAAPARGKKGTRRVQAESARAVSVARTAGG